MEGFLSYEWSKDTKWQAYQLNIEIPPGRDRDSVLLKYKYKFYKRYVDEKFEIPKEDNLKNNESANTTTNTNSTNSNTNTNTNTNNSTNTNTNACNNNNDSFFNFLKSSHGISFTFNALIVVHSIAYLFASLFSPYSANGLFNRGCLCALITYIFSLYQIVGLPSLNRDYWSRVLMHSSSHYLFLILIVLTGPPIGPALFTFTIFATFQVTNVLSTRLSNWNPSLSTKLTPYLNLINSKSNQALSIVSQLELSVGFFLLLQIFTYSFSRVLTFYLYIQFMILRYLLSNESKLLIDYITSRIDQSCPNSLRGIWNTIRANLAAMVRARQQGSR